MAAKEGFGLLNRARRESSMVDSCLLFCAGTARMLFVDLGVPRQRAHGKSSVRVADLIAAAIWTPLATADSP